MGFSGGSPSVPKPPPPPPEVDPIDEEAEEELARQRKSLEAQRAGRQSLVIKPMSNPGVAAAPTGGLRIGGPA